MPAFDQGRVDDPRAGDGVLAVVSDRCRRHALALLLEREQPITREDLATRVAARKHDKPPAQVTDEEHREELVSLHHVHLPKLEDAGVVERDSGGIVATVDDSIADLIGHDGVREENIDAFLDTLSDPRRRKLLVVLSGLDDGTFPLPVDEMAEVLAESDGSTPDDGSPDRVLATLHHRDLPRLDDAGIIAYDREDGTVHLREGASS